MQRTREKIKLILTTPVLSVPWIPHLDMYDPFIPLETRMYSKTTASIPQENTLPPTGSQIGILCDGSTSLMISVGHQTGLFMTMRNLGPADSGSIAQSAHLNEQYVREWLGNMTATQIVTYDHQLSQYTLEEQQSIPDAEYPSSLNTIEFHNWINLLGFTRLEPSDVSGKSLESRKQTVDRPRLQGRLGVRQWTPRAHGWS
jgi:hypothetical protein